MINFQFTLKSWQIWYEFVRASSETLEKALDKITVDFFIIEERLGDTTEVLKSFPWV